MEYIYNITAAIDTDIALSWAEEAAASFLPALKTVPGVTGVELIEVETPDDLAPEQGRTYTVQVRFEEQKALDDFIGEAERRAEQTLFDRFGQRYATFRLRLRSLYRL